MLRYSDWLKEFLGKRGFLVPNGRQLFAYQCTLEEYGVLRRLLRAYGVPTDHSHDASFAACFVLFGAEWYRREYQISDGWSWDGIHRSLDFALDAATRKRVVPQGLESYWKRTLHVYDSSIKNFLGSVFSEGGLPFQMLRASDSRFKILFQRMLNNYDSAHALGYGTTDLAQREVERLRLPQVFRSEDSVRLIASMADQLVHLVADYGLHRSNDPVAAIDRSAPHWRSSFPLPLDEQTGKQLLNNLLTTATEKRKRQAAGGGAAACNHYWSEQAPSRLSSHIVLPESVVFKLAAMPAATRFELAISDGSRILVNMGPAYATLEMVGATVRAAVRVVRREALVRREDASASLVLVAMVGGEVIADEEIPDSSVALGDAPLGFAWQDDQWQLTGQASFNTEAERVLVALPEGSSWEVAPEVAAKRSELQPFSLHAIEVTGTADVRVLLGDIFRIRTGQSTGTRVSLEFFGKRVDWPTTPANSFIGPPSVRWAHDAGSGTEECLRFVEGQALASVSPTQQLGVQFWSARNTQGNTLLRRKLAVLPSDFELRLRSGSLSGQGRIAVQTKTPCRVHVVNQAGLQIEESRSADGVELILAASGVPPEHVRLQVVPNDSVAPVEFVLPFPGLGCMAFDGAGNTLPNTLSVDDLLGARLHLSGPGRGSAIFELFLSLRGCGGRSAYYKWSYKVTERPMEISLFTLTDQIRNLLSLSADIDTTVVLEVLLRGTVLLKRVIRSYRKEGELQRSMEPPVFELQDDEVQPLQMFLENPYRRPVLLQQRLSDGVNTGVFEINPFLLEKGGFQLIVPDRENASAFRPVLLRPSTLPEKDGGASNLREAARQFDPNDPCASFAPVFDAMASNPAHGSWGYLKALRDNFGYLPLGTFEAWRQLATRHPRALVMAMLKFEAEPDFMVRLEGEFPMLWELLPVQDVLEVIGIFRQHLLANDVEPGVVQELIDEIISRFKIAAPTLAQVLSDLLKTSTPRLIPAQVLTGWAQNLITTHANMSWPDFNHNAFRKWHASLPGPILNFTIAPSYRDAVIYFPVFAAMVACGRASLKDLGADASDSETIFHLRRLRDFDMTWFDPIYQMTVQNNY